MNRLLSVPLETEGKTPECRILFQIRNSITRGQRSRERLSLDGFTITPLYLTLLHTSTSLILGGRTPCVHVSLLIRNLNRTNVSSQGLDACILSHTQRLPTYSFRHYWGKSARATCPFSLSSDTSHFDHGSTASKS